MRTSPVLALTPGEPAGIGPDLCVRLHQTSVDSPVAIIADAGVLSERAKQLGLPLTLPAWPGRERAEPGFYHYQVDIVQRVTAGRLTVTNAPYVMKTLEIAVEGCLKREFDALVTGPVHKGILNEAGIVFSGHTEFLARRCAIDQVVMLMSSPGLRIALATTHLPLSEVSRTLTAVRLQRILEILDSELRLRFGIEQPKILICGLNPHAGEDGYLGREEQTVIGPVIETLRARGLNLIGPIPADTAFIPSRLQGVDVVLTMYHDQGLPVLKHHNFRQAVNITLGLPFIRTSVDHGTALELAGTGRADISSLQAAIDQARLLCQ
jgi:4-hydroxythreonine-4-phosphate dehydrogenase